MTPATQEIVGVAQQLADDVLFPRALETDAADTVPRDLLDQLAGAGLYGLSGPTWAGGIDAGFDTACAVFEALAGGCLTTTFVWAQHIGAVRAAAASESPHMRDWVEPLCRGTRRSGLALAGVLPGPPRLRARRADGGWLLAGSSPWISGWGRMDVIYTSARDETDNVVWSLVDAQESPSLRVERLALVALNATNTVRADFDKFFVPDERVTSIVPPEQWTKPESAVLRIHAAFGLGVAGRCCRLLGPSRLDDELAACRSALDAATAETMPRARAAVSDLALRAAAALMSTVGSRSVLLDEHAQCLAREALFVSVYASRPPVRAALLELLGAGPFPK